ncbi:hypothetical protein HDU93_001781, partial [Gonapodya sp. JEL0774]
MAALTVTVHFYHDITCPWSLIGKKRLDRALQTLYDASISSIDQTHSSAAPTPLQLQHKQHPLAIRLICHPYFINPNHRLEGPPTAHDARSEATRNMVIAGRIERLKQVAREEGVELSLRTHPSLPPVSSTPGARGHAEPDPLNRPSTVMAHTAVAWVAEEARRGVGEGRGDGVARTGEGGRDSKDKDDHGGRGRGKLQHRDNHTMDNRDKTADWSFTKMLNRAVKSLARRGRPKSGRTSTSRGPAPPSPSSINPPSSPLPDTDISYAFLSDPGDAAASRLVSLLSEAYWTRGEDVGSEVVVRRWAK